MVKLPQELLDNKEFMIEFDQVIVLASLLDYELHNNETKIDLIKRIRFRIMSNGRYKYEIMIICLENRFEYYECIYKCIDNTNGKKHYGETVEELVEMLKKIKENL